MVHVVAWHVRNPRFFIFAFCEPLTGETNFLQTPYTFQWLKLKCLSRQLSVMLFEASFHTSGVARAFLGGRVAHPED